MKKIRACAFLSALLIPCVLQAQSTRVRGMVTDAETDEPVPFATVAFLNTPVNITTGFDGMYALETRLDAKEIGVVASGYRTQVVDVTPGSFQVVNFKLRSTDIELEKVVVTSDDSYERAILARTIAARDRNNPARIPHIDCDLYTKTELDLSNIGSTFRKVMPKSFSFVLDYVDTSALTGTTYLPVMITETSSHYYQQAAPEEPLTREVIRANRISGVSDDASVSQFTGNLYVNINLYDNYINLFEVQFASPLSAHGTLYYKYFLVDSLQVDGRKTYAIRFHPRSLSTPVLEGELHIDATDYALQSAHVHMMKGLNINWVRAWQFDLENVRIDDRYWYKRQERMFADFSVVMSDSTKALSFLGHRQVDYMNPRLDAPFPADVLKSDYKVLVEDNDRRLDETYWQSVRPYALSPHEQRIFQMVDSIKHVPLYRDIQTLVTTFIGGYYEMGVFSIGPYYKLISFNNLEGLRIQAGGRTTNEYSKRFRISAYAAYGFDDHTWKGMGGFEYVIHKQPQRKIEAYAKHDVVQLGLSEGAISESNLFSSVLSRGGNQRLNMMDRAEFVYRRDWSRGLEAAYGVRYQVLHDSRFVPFVLPDGRETHDPVQSLSVSVENRFSWDEVTTYGNFVKYHTYTRYPVVTARLIAGARLTGDDVFCRAEAAVNYSLKLPPLGTSRIQVEAGRLFGRVPYPLLKIHEGNGTYFYDETAFACMDYYEFASDAWVSWRLEHDFKGFFLGRIPLINRLKWRETVSFRGVYGTLRSENDGSTNGSDALMLFPEGMSSLHRPYLEAGLGVKNILRVFRVDTFWRLTHREEKQNAGNKPSYVLNLGVELNF